MARTAAPDGEAPQRVGFAADAERAADPQQVLLELAVRAAVAQDLAHASGVITPGQPGGPWIGDCHQIPFKLSGKWVETLWNREAKGQVAPLAL